MDQRELKIILRLKDELSAELQKVTGRLEDGNMATSRWSSALSLLKVTGIAAAGAIATALTGVVTYGLRVASQLEMAEIGMRTLLGSSEAAAETIKRLKVEAARTPFELTGLTEATQSLALVTKDGNKAIDILLDVGKALAASGKGQAELDRIVLNLQQIGNTGKITEMDVRQFGMNGVNVLEIMADYYTKTGKAAVTTANAAGLNEKAIAKLGKTYSAEQKKIESLNVTLEKQNNRLREMVKNDKDHGASYKNLQIDIEQTKKKIAEYTTEMTKNGATMELAKKTITSYGSAAVVTKEQAGEMLKDSKDAFGDLAAALKMAGSEGGRFANAYTNAMGSFSQLLSNLKDSVALFSAEFVKQTGIFDGLKVAMFNAAVVLNSFDFAAFKQSFNDLMLDIDEKTGLITLMQIAWQFVADTFRNTLWPALQELWVALQPFLPYLKDLAGILGTSLVIAIGAFVIGLASITAGLAKALEWVTKFVTNGLKGMSWYIEVITNAIAGLILMVEDLIESFKSAIEWASKLNVVQGAKNIIKSVLPGRASGGPVTSGMPYIVGERGPEVFVPQGSGNIVPNGAGGVTVNVYGDVSGDELVRKVTDAITRNIKYNVRLA